MNSKHKIYSNNSLERAIELRNGDRRKEKKPRKFLEYKVDYNPPPYNESLKLSKDVIYDAVIRVIKSGMVINSSELAEMCWPGMRGRDPRHPNHHHYSSQVTMALKTIPGAVRDRDEPSMWKIK
jgi:hypothetical protein